MSIIVALLIFSLIVFIHELGHFYFARRGGIAVEEFAIGMGPKLFGFNRKGTEWTIRILPIGGFCKMHGEDGEAYADKDNIELTDDKDDDSSSDKSVAEVNTMADVAVEESSVTEVEESSVTEVENLQEKLPEVQPKRVLNGGAFYEKSVWVRISAVIGGPLFNFILAFVFAIIYVSLSPISTTIIEVAPEDMPAFQAGIEVGDKLVSIDGHTLITPLEARIYINMAKGEPVEAIVKREDINGDIKKVSVMIQPDYVIVDDTVPLEEQQKSYFIGIGYGQASKNILSVVKHGFLQTVSMVKIVFYSLKLLVTDSSMLKQISGPVGIISVISNDYKDTIAVSIKAALTSVAFYIMLISANLGVMNLLPIPALDGGRLVFLTIEAIRGKPVAPEKEGFVHFVGFVLLMVLMLFVVFNDVTKLIN